MSENTNEQSDGVIDQPDGWADSGSREAQAHPGIHGTYHRYDVVEWSAPTSCEYTADYEHPICPVNECASGDDGHECRMICQRIGVEGGSGAWECPHHGFFRVFDYPAEPDRETEQATLLADGGRVQEGDETDTPDTRTVTTPISDELRATLARAAALDPDSVRVVDADVRDGALAVELEGERA